MQESPKLTDRQQQILDLVQSAIERTRRAAHPGPKSPTSSASDRPTPPRSIFRALARKGVIELIGGTSRGIRLQS